MHHFIWNFFVLSGIKAFPLNLSKRQSMGPFSFTQEPDHCIFYLLSFAAEALQLQTFAITLNMQNWKKYDFYTKDAGFTY